MLFFQQGHAVTLLVLVVLFMLLLFVIWVTHLSVCNIRQFMDSRALESVDYSQKIKRKLQSRPLNAIWSSRMRLLIMRSTVVVKPSPKSVNTHYPKRWHDVKHHAAVVLAKKKHKKMYVASHCPQQFQAKQSSLSNCWVGQKWIVHAHSHYTKHWHKKDHVMYSINKTKSSAIVRI